MTIPIIKIRDEDVAAHLAVMQEQIEQLTKTVDVLTTEVKALTALANQGKGSLRMLLLIGTIWTGLIGFLGFALLHITWR
ncbi:MAG TPA: hypothetical protein DIV86_01575 [Alphaproteobacteria bacterium]|nr:hypothetical protein [Alphaproteobacteria bacterium]